MVAATGSSSLVPISRARRARGAGGVEDGELLAGLEQLRRRGEQHAVCAEVVHRGRALPPPADGVRRGQPTRKSGERRAACSPGRRRCPRAARTARWPRCSDGRRRRTGTSCRCSPRRRGSSPARRARGRRAAPVRAAPSRSRQLLDAGCRGSGRGTVRGAWRRLQGEQHSLVHVGHHARAQRLEAGQREHHLRGRGAAAQRRIERRAPHRRTVDGPKPRKAASTDVDGDRRGRADRRSAALARLAPWRAVVHRVAAAGCARARAAAPSSTARRAW